MNEMTFNILKLVLSVCTILITIYVLPYLKAKLKADKYNDLMETIRKAVLAAEQKLGAGEGKLKKAEVLSFVMDYISKEGLDIAEDVVDMIIESYVFELNQEIK